MLSCLPDVVFVSLQLSSNLCKAHGPRPSDSSSRLCHYLPVVQEQIELVISNLMTWNGCLAVLSLIAACAGSWHFWELAYVEKKAAKHKRRRKQRKNSVPWDKITVRRVTHALMATASALMSRLLTSCA